MPHTEHLPFMPLCWNTRVNIIRGCADSTRACALLVRDSPFVLMLSDAALANTFLKKGRGIVVSELI